MASDLQKSRNTVSAVRKMLVGDLKDNPDERLKVYNMLADTPFKGTGKSPSDHWVSMMLKAVQDPWSRIRKLGRQCLLRIASTQTGVQKKRYIKQLLNLVRDRWPRVRNWYEKEGLLLLLLDVLSFAEPTSLEEGLLANMLLLLVLPSVSDPQLPVSDAAVEVALLVTQRSENLASFTVDYNVVALRKTCIFDKTGVSDPLTTAGHLGCLAKLLALHAGLYTTRLMADLHPILQQLSAYPAASLRQQVARVWALRSVENFDMALTTMVEKAHAPSDSDEWWCVVETLLMALQEQLTYYLCFPEKARALKQMARGTIVKSLYAVLVLIEAKQFEVARMAKQVLPLLTQFVVRFTESLAFLGELLGKEAARFQERTNFAFPFLSDLVWFLVIRRYVRPAGEATAVQKAVMQYLIPSLVGEGDVSGNIDTEGVAATRGHVDDPLSVILVCTYFPECLKEPAGKRLLKFAIDEAAWRKAFSCFGNVVQYASDFTLLIRQEEVSAGQLLPLWFNWLAGAYTHQQCLILDAIKVAIAPKEQLVGRKRLSFAYHSAFYAPTMKDEGEEVPLGFHWLKQRFPSEELLPETQPVPMNNMEGVEDVLGDLHNVVYRKLYAYKGTEPSVLNAVRSLMMAECGAMPQHKTLAAVVSAVVTRLDSVAPEWRGVLVTQGAKSVGETTAATSRTGDAPSGGCNNWDDSDSEENVAGVSPDEEIRNARTTLSALVYTHFDGREEAFIQAVCATGSEDVRKLLR
ncbi:uncharacterized protein TEOVI_000525500 [Trypanosoma equiperdum]|uniref:Importin N-terminal domain-containing protein n=2 Tax=Trypanozoon TaxID=39700 RepID=Q38AQ0_TRYB2|nr:hypothetical protein, conserved [Trypanosoma brucei brucei TREU927]EAN78120.1 hypothetical protein, conserved [Trypanosoma brucei brucei TREU927]SCU68800.1 hypothetical protein, conserved [Trypanosoma equiperdum]